MSSRIPASVGSARHDGGGGLRLQQALAAVDRRDRVGAPVRRCHANPSSSGWSPCHSTPGGGCARAGARGEDCHAEAASASGRLSRGRTFMYQPTHFREDRLDVQHALDPRASLGDPGQPARGRPRGQPDPVPARRRTPRRSARCAPMSPAPIRNGARSTPTRGGAGRVPGGRHLRHAVLVCLQARARQGRADLELRDRPGLGPAAGDRGPGVAGAQIRALTARARGPARRALGGRGRARAVHRHADQGRSSGSRSRSPGSRASGRRARTGRRPTATGVAAGLERQGDEASLAMARAGARARSAVDRQQCRQALAVGRDRPAARPARA